LRVKNGFLHDIKHAYLLWLRRNRGFRYPETTVSGDVMDGMESEEDQEVPDHVAWKKG